MKHKYLGKLKQSFKKMLNIVSEAEDICVSIQGLEKHLLKRHHENMLPYMTYLADIIENPDYIGVNPREKDESLEFVKVYDDNVLVAIKLHKSGEFFYVPTMYELQEYKLQSRIKSGRLKKVDDSKR